MKKLSEEEIKQRLSTLNNWKYENNKLTKEFKFNNFDDSVNFLKLIQPTADALDHHPDVCIYYNRVIIELTTHDLGGISDLDFELAEKIDELSTHVKS
ncbi:4a-hydroxytetrahydrobiopterin dehydratase [Acidianus sulfidivorans JP7]|uniref:Putative pterin-4-alpha-carbinolamine dehydratase n=1 Tax=Acidianus sulfidivorans JP7 TaxID=619593 RepID=A0A2U9IKE3_9CREN|nr:4a-hydroxytetrahydrobiopterin dehydratase [Acidianus sulfidivorans]AWR96498.1 4a-hydroxytetrahydrobiopterin dehydratase [Acidianus sulfidivorans JP7]